MEKVYKTFKDLEAWKSAMELAKLIYGATKGFPEYEKFGLTNQMRRAAVSVPSNIAEGHGRRYKKETLQYLYITKSSLNEIETQAIIALEEKMMQEENYKMIEEKILQTRKLTIGFIQYLERNKGLN